VFVYYSASVDVTSVIERVEYTVVDPHRGVCAS